LLGPYALKPTECHWVLWGFWRGAGPLQVMVSFFLSQVLTATP